MKPKYLIGLIVIVAMSMAAFFMLDESSIEYSDLDRAERLGKTVQVVGTWIKDNGSKYDAAGNVFSFHMQDEKGARIFVELDGPKPNNFEMATSIVVKGRVDGSTFKASHVLTKCPSKYEGNASDLKPAS